MTDQVMSGNILSVLAIFVSLWSALATDRYPGERAFWGTLCIVNTILLIKNILNVIK